MLTLVTPRCGRLFMLLPPADTWAYLAISANSKLQLGILATVFVSTC